MTKINEHHALSRDALAPVWNCVENEDRFWDGGQIFYRGGYVRIYKSAGNPWMEFYNIPNKGDKHILLTNTYSEDELKEMSWIDVICDYSTFNREELINGTYNTSGKQTLTEKTENDTNNRVGVLIFNENGKFLIEHAPNKPHDKNSWDLPKGHVSFDDPSLEYAVKRECFEETGIFLDKVKELGTFSYINPYDIGDMTKIGRASCRERV